MSKLEFQEVEADKKTGIELHKIAAGASLAPATPQKDFKSLLNANWEKIASVMPKTASPDRLMQLAISSYNQTEHLAECSTVSVLSCVMKCAALGLEPSAVDGLGRAYILPYRNKKTGTYEAQFIMGYRGMIDLARRSGQIESISAHVVREGDEFEYEYGLDERLRHIPSRAPKEGREITHAYCVAHFTDGGHFFNVITSEDIAEARKASQSGASKFSPWANWPDQMAMKTAVRRAFPYLPVSIEAQQAAMADETVPDYRGVLNPMMEVPDERE